MNNKQLVDRNAVMSKVFCCLHNGLCFLLLVLEQDNTGNTLVIDI